MDIKEMLKDTIEDVVNKIKSDKTIAANFQRDPIGTVEKLLDVDLPNEHLEPLVEAVKAKINLDNIGDMIGGLGKLFGK
jgi:hypothetical protein